MHGPELSEVTLLTVVVVDTLPTCSEGWSQICLTAQDYEGKLLRWRVVYVRRFLVKMNTLLVISQL